MITRFIGWKMISNYLLYLVPNFHSNEYLVSLLNYIIWHLESTQQSIRIWHIAFEKVLPMMSTFTMGDTLATNSPLPPPSRKRIKEKY